MKYFYTYNLMFTYVLLKTFLQLRIQELELKAATQESAKSATRKGRLET